MVAEAADAQAFPMRGIAQPTREQALTLPQVYLSQHPVVAHKITRELFGGHHLDVHHRFEQNRFRLLDPLLECERTGDLECHFRGVNIVK